MSDWTAKPGDKIRRINPLSGGVPTLTVDYVGTGVVVFTAHLPTSTSQYSRTITAFYENYEPAPEVFEAGKSYALADTCYGMTCLYADDTVAVLKSDNGAKYLRSQDRRNDYREVTE